MVAAKITLVSFRMLDDVILDTIELFVGGTGTADGGEVGAAEARRDRRAITLQVIVKVVVICCW